MVGFNSCIVFDNNGKINDYQIGYTNNYKKLIKAFLPFSFNESNSFSKAIIKIAIQNTFPRKIVTLCGKQAKSDPNCYIFDITNTYTEYLKYGLGLMSIEIVCDNGNKFKSHSFRGCQ